jgi:MFS transporter, OFA family, oxalate/formate antiporter
VEDRNLGWRVALAGVGVNLALGVLYTWSVIAGGIPKSWGWSAADRSLPYAVACFVFALSMIPAGRLQDRYGPRWVIMAGGFLMGAGLIVSSIAGSSLLGFVVGFGGLTGVGIGFGYASATPAAVKWFPSAKTGMIAGIVVAGFGLASVYIAPLATTMLKNLGLSATLMYLGIAFMVVVMLLSLLVRNPPAGYKPEGGAEAVSDKSAPAAVMVERNVHWKDMIKTSQFWILWLMYAFGSATGLMLIGIAKPLGTMALGEAAFWVVIMLAVGNAGGRVLAGMVSDKIGRQWTMFGAYVIQAVMVFSLLFVQQSAVMLLLIVTIAGANYGANLAIFPSATKDYFGIKNFGLNYGIMFTAWGVGGLILPRINGLVIDATGNSKITFILAGSLMILAAMLTFVSRLLASHDEQVAEGGHDKTKTADKKLQPAS